MIQNGILFENFVLNDANEKGFSYEVFLPIFLKVFHYFKLKPIIVALSPTEIEHEEFWACYNIRLKEKISDIMQ